MLIQRNHSHYLFWEWVAVCNRMSLILVFSRIHTLVFVLREFTLSESLNICFVCLYFMLLHASLYLFRKWLTSGRTMVSSKARRGSALITKSYFCVSGGISVTHHVFEVKVFTAFCLNQWPVSFLRTIQRYSDRPPMPDVFSLFSFLKCISKKVFNKEF